VFEDSLKALEASVKAFGRKGVGPFTAEGFTNGEMASTELFRNLDRTGSVSATTFFKTGEASFPIRFGAASEETIADACGDTTVLLGGATAGAMACGAAASGTACMDGARDTTLCGCEVCGATAGAAATRKAVWRGLKCGLTVVLLANAAEREVADNFVGKVLAVRLLISGTMTGTAVDGAMIGVIVG